MKTVAIESPWRAATLYEQLRNRRYILDCVSDCLRRGESPYASHLMLTEVLDDADEAQRNTGLWAGFEWSRKAEARVVYTDLGVSAGMELGIKHAADIDQVTEYRTLGGVWRKK